MRISCLRFFEKADVADVKVLDCREILLRAALVLPSRASSHWPSRPPKAVPQAGLIPQKRLAAQYLNLSGNSIDQLPSGNPFLVGKVCLQEIRCEREAIARFDNSLQPSQRLQQLDEGSSELENIVGRCPQ